MKDQFSKTFRGWIGDKESARLVFLDSLWTALTCPTAFEVPDRLGKPRKVIVTVTVKIEDAK
jgi:hypothetical protein